VAGAATGLFNLGEAFKNFYRNLYDEYERVYFGDW
jgi:hypothetical protein